MIQVETAVGQPRPSLFTKQMVLNAASLTVVSTVRLAMLRTICSVNSEGLGSPAA
jgi:hypothetical protein